MTAVSWIERRRRRRAERRAAPYPSVARRVVSGIELLVVLAISGFLLALATGLVVAAALLLVDRALAA